jgi:hypothetical protein
MASGYDVKFILCEDMRQETSGKVSLAGVYPGEKIVLLRNTPGFALDDNIAVLRLTFVAFIRGPEGDVGVRVVVTRPDRRPTIASVDTRTKLQRDKTSTVAIIGPNFPVPALGKYGVRFLLNDEPHDFHFEIEAGPEFVLPKVDRKAVPRAAKKTPAAKKRTKA